MRKLGIIDLEILDLAMSHNGTFDEKNLEGSELKRLGVGKILDSLATLKDRNMLALNSDGSFTITNVAKDILWNKDVPKWARILRLLQIRSCNIEEIAGILKVSDKDLAKEIEKLRKSQLVLMSPQRKNDMLVKVFEILPEGIEEIDKTEIQGFDSVKIGDEDTGNTKQRTEILDMIDQIAKEIHGLEIEQTKKESIIKRLNKLKDELEI